MKTLTLHSFKGGAGKTTLAINFAVELANRGFKVVLIENDLFMPTFVHLFQQYMLNIPKKFTNDLFFAPKETKIEDAIVRTTLNTDIICADPMFNPEHLFSINDKKLFRTWLITLQKLKSKLEKEHKYDIMIIDTSPGWNFLVINNLLICDFAILVLRLNKYEVIGTKKMLEDIYFKTREWKDNLFIVWNQVPRVDYKPLLSKFSEILEPVETLGIIPASCRYSHEIAKGNILLEKAETQTVKNELKTILNSLLKYLG